VPDVTVAVRVTSRQVLTQTVSTLAVSVTVTAPCSASENGASLDCADTADPVSTSVLLSSTPSVARVGRVPSSVTTEAGALGVHMPSSNVPVLSGVHMPSSNVPVLSGVHMPSSNVPVLSGVHMPSSNVPVLSGVHMPSSNVRVAVTASGVQRPSSCLPRSRATVVLPAVTVVVMVFVMVGGGAGALALALVVAVAVAVLVTHTVVVARTDAGRVTVVEW